MPEIEIRPAVPDDIAKLVELDHTFTTGHVWQMEFNREREIGQIDLKFRRVRLPHAVRYDYHRPAKSLIDDWSQLSGLLVATIMGKPVGYSSLILDRVTKATWVSDLIVDKIQRRKGIGRALLLSAADWASTKESRLMVLEMQLKNGPAIEMALKLGFEFCGYNDFYYPVNQIGIFFRKSL